MAKQRIINTKFWVDEYISKLDPIEKLLFLYFLTNPATDISGVYEIPLKNVAVDTGIEVEMVKKILARFSRDKRIYYRKGWVGITNFTKHQTQNPKVLKGIEIGLSKAPEELVERMNIDFEFSEQEQSKEYIRKKIPLSIRKAVIERDGRVCQFCGKTNQEALLEIDHIVPVRHGGGNNLENLRVLCQQCNGARNGGRTMGGLSHSNSNLNSNSNNIMSPKATTSKNKNENEPIVWEEYLKSMDDSKTGHIPLIAYFFKRKGLKFDTRGEVEVAIRRHSKPAVEVLKFEKQKVVKAMDRCDQMERRDGIRWTLETVLKELTK